MFTGSSRGIVHLGTRAYEKLEWLRHWTTAPESFFYDNVLRFHQERGSLSEPPSPPSPRGGVWGVSRA